MPQKSQRPHRKLRFRRRPFSPPEPTILAGRFVGRKLGDLSDEELTFFLQVDAAMQSNPPLATGWFPPSCPDVSQYWFAKYELERRKPETQRSGALDIQSSDSQESIAAKLFDFAFRAASRKYHPDRGGDTATMQAINAAREFARSRLRS
jgi:hypothetical protein